MSHSDIHPVLIVRNAERTIEKTLASLRAFPEVTIYDNGSTDRTLELCRAFANTRIHTGEFFGFGPTYNHAAELAPGDWVLSIHADEQLSEELVASLASVDLSNPAVAYAFERHNVFMGKDVRHAGWGKHWMIRLYNRRTCKFDDAPVHEKLLLGAGTQVVRLSGIMWHDAVTDLDQFLQKVSYYSELRRKRRAKVHPPVVILIRAWWAFVRTYFLQLGVLEGWRGMVIAVSNANGTFFRHMKRYADSAVAAEAARALETPGNTREEGVASSPRAPAKREG
jgi:glycosyltransferase involved in cell wall biosynthesis